MNNHFQLSATENDIKIDGNLNYSSASKANEQFETLSKSHQGSILTLACKDLTRVDSAGLAVLLEWKNWCKNHNKEFKISDLPQQAQSLIETYRLQEVI